MSANVQAAFRALTGDGRTWWDATQKRFRAFKAQLSAIGKEFPDHQVIVMHGSGRERFGGLQWSKIEINQSGGAEKFAPAGGLALWRYERKHHMWVPRLSTPAGKELNARLTASWHMGAITGMPEFVSIFSFPGVEFVGDQMLVVWSVPHEHVTRSPSYDASMWEPLKLSQYHALIEEHGKSNVPSKKRRVAS